MDSPILTMTKIPRSRQDYLFVPMNSLMEVLLGKSGLRSHYEGRRKDDPRWPTYKSLVKYSSGNENDLPSRPSSLSKLDHFYAYFNDRFQNSIVLDDFHWDRYPEWFGFLQGFPFNSEITRFYWLDMLKKGRLLAFSLWKKRGDISGSMALYNDSVLVNIIGLPTARKIVKNESSFEVLNKKITVSCSENTIVADQYTVIVRLVAWIVADRLLDFDKNHIVAEMENGAFLDFLLPRLNAMDSSWSNSVRNLFEKLAEISGCKKDRAFVPFLAERWDFSEKDLKYKTDLKDKERLIRMWIDDKRIVDPLPEKMESCMRSLCSANGIFSNADLLVDVLYLAIAFRKIWHYLKNTKMIPDVLLTDIFSVYSQEYDHATRVIWAE